MNDEIKEMLDKLKDGNWYNELDLTGTMWIELRWEETHLLLDYITNLQQENETLHENNQNMQEEMAKVWEENERLKEWKKDLLNENIELENIRKEAIEYIKNRKEEYINAGATRVAIKAWHYNKLINDLLNILQNGSDEE